VTPPEDAAIAPPSRGGDGLPELPDEPAAEGSAAAEEHLRSLRDDVEALIDDAKTYLEAEIGYQKTRAAFVADRAKAALVCGALAVAFGILALIGLTVGLIFSLTPLLTAWGASALVVGLLAIAALLSLRAAGRRWNKLMAAIDSQPERQP